MSRLDEQTLLAVEKATNKITLGIEALLDTKLDLVAGKRVGLVCNQASVDHDVTHAADLLFRHSEINLTTLFGPQHGIRGDVQDNMVETAHDVDVLTGKPVFSLYSETREPTASMLENVDVLVIDLQDVGCRIYTFAYTMANCMRVARKLGKRVVVCDRPNPIGGERVEGNLLELGFESFVGQFPIPTRHGMTIGELAQMFNDLWKIGCELDVVRMDGWERETWFDQTDVPWVLPSPNMPSLDAATVFPGTVHLEGTNMSEGRGTTRPFELIGAPYVNAWEFSSALNELNLPGVRFRAANFLPTFQKHAGSVCGGVQIHVFDREVFEPVITGVATVKLCRDLYGDGFDWKKEAYEYVFDRNPFDVISGTDRLRVSLESGESLHAIKASWQAGLNSFKRDRKPYLLY
jgi:uncharacterized protein YbbC (DUF1343 family)